MSTEFDKKFLEITKAEGVPAPKGAVANYVPTKQIGNILYTSGQAPFVGDDLPARYLGKLGVIASAGGVTNNLGTEAARITTLNLLWNVREALGSLDKVESIISLEGMVNCCSSFTEHSTIVNGASDLLVEIFGDQGKHTRAATGHNSLAFDICVEIRIIVEVKA
jgi:enamine deaminase RidA (YjgF/YER057c/UK114 family)